MVRSVQVGVAYYSQRLYDQAESCFETVRNRDPFRLQHIDTYSNILYVKEKAAELSFLAHNVVEVRNDFRAQSLSLVTRKCVSVSS